MSILLLAVALSAAAETTVQPKSKVAQVIAELLPNATSVSSFCQRDSDTCRIEWTNKPGKTASFTDHAANRQTMLDELAAIEDAIDAGAVTEAQRRRFMKLILKLNGWNRRP